MPGDQLKKKGSSLDSLFDRIDDQESEKTTGLDTDDDGRRSSVSSQRSFDSISSFSGDVVDSEVTKNSSNSGSVFSSNISNDGNESGKLAQCIAILKVVNDVVFDEREMEEDQKSQARKNDEIKYQSLKNSINEVVTKYDKKISKHGTDLEKYLNFIGSVSAFDNPITSEKIIELSKILQPEDKANSLNRKTMKIRRAVIGFAAGFFLKGEDVNKYNKLSKSEKKKIKLVRELIELEKNSEILAQDKQNRYAEINRSFISLDSKDKRIEKKQSLRILAKQIHKEKLFTRDTAAQFKDKILHPYTKITDREDLSLSEKTLKVGSKFLKKAAKGGGKAVKKVGEVVLESGQSMIKHTVKQPAATVYRGSMAILNAVEYLTLEAKILSEKDPAIKENLKKEAEIKFQNMGYEGEKFIRAAAATVGVALLDLSMAATIGGAAAPAAIGLKVSGEVIRGALIASQVADNIENSRGAVKKINDGYKNYQEQEALLTLIEKRLVERRNATHEGIKQKGRSL